MSPFLGSHSGREHGDAGEGGTLAGELNEVLALVNEKVTYPRIDALGMVGEIAGDVSEGIAGDEGAAGLEWGIGPLEDDQQGLFGTV